MTHEDAGHYSLKHPSGTEINQQIADRIKAAVVGNMITCKAAHKIADELGVKPGDVGVTVDLLEVRISKCQLGLYGYGTEGKVVRPAKVVSPELDAAIGKSAVNGKLTCLESWKIAKEFGITRMEISSACETLKIKMSSCQLGSF
ncbi:MAG: hypothetical protein JXB42_06800 [Deltaproteobacteria bacterium]|nr:hypothetical protein [Deltaproteobacteria bacterium]